MTASARMTVAARMLLVPRPEPIGNCTLASDLQPTAEIGQSLFQGLALHRNAMQL